MRLHACILAFLCFGAMADELRPIARGRRPVEILPEQKVSDILARMPPVWDPLLRDTIDSSDTMWYDRTVIIPGYQDSYGDGSHFPVGFRPNTIQSNLIDQAVPGGHGWLFVRSGEFHFPFGRTGHPDDAKNTFVVDFFRLPREGSTLLPVVYWKHEPNANTHRIEWMFPIGTIFGEVIFITDSSGRSHVFEIRTRTRKSDTWEVDIFRPFPTAESLAEALDLKRQERTTWATSSALANVLSHLRNPSTVMADTFGGTHFKGAFAPINGGVDKIPALNDETLVAELLRQTPFRSAKYSVWKQSGGLAAFAASTNENFSIVPKNYNAAHFEVTDAFCNRCHQDAGRPFKDYYRDVIAYGELWGEDDTFSWHPFEAKHFVDGNGNVVSFNNDNRKFRQDFVNAGIVVPFNASVHGRNRYEKLNRSWKNYRY